MIMSELLESLELVDKVEPMLLLLNDNLIQVFRSSLPFMFREMAHLDYKLV